MFALEIANGDVDFISKVDDKLVAEPLLVPASGLGEGVDFCPNIEGPFAVAKGEEVAA